MNAAASSARWLYPGMRVKRWIALALVGLCAGLLGLSVLRGGAPIDALAPFTWLLQAIGEQWQIDLTGDRSLRWSAWVLFGCGGLVFGFAVFRLWNSVSSAVSPSGKRKSLVDSVYRNRILAMGPSVVVIGGGTGLSTLLRGLKQYTSNIVAVVTVADDGGSSGKLQKQLGILPPGDIRNCLAALAEAEGSMMELFQYRFRNAEAGEALKEHAFGNLLIAALCDLQGGDFEKAVRETSRVLNIRGRVLPSTLEHVKLQAEMEDGSTIEGETAIAASPKKIKRMRLVPGGASAPEEVTDAIREADLVVIGPGSVFTSIVPNLLVCGIAEAIYRSKARKVYICNVMTQPGETEGFTAADHLRVVQAHSPVRIVDTVIVNTGTPSGEMIQRYGKQGAGRVEPDTDRIRALGCRPVAGDFVNQSDYVRHDSIKLAEALMKLADWNPIRAGLRK